MCVASTNRWVRVTCHNNTHFARPGSRDCPSAAPSLRNHIVASNWTTSPVALSANGVAAPARGQSQRGSSGIATMTSRYLASVRSQGKSKDGLKPCIGEKSSTGLTRSPTLLPRVGAKPSQLLRCVWFVVLFSDPQHLVIVAVKNCWLL